MRRHGLGRARRAWHPGGEDVPARSTSRRDLDSRSHRPPRRCAAPRCGIDHSPSGVRDRLRLQTGRGQVEISGGAGTADAIQDQIGDHVAFPIRARWHRVQLDPSLISMRATASPPRKVTLLFRILMDQLVDDLMVEELQAAAAACPRSSTCTPRAANIEASSMPITPPPTTAMVCGILSSPRIAVEDRINVRPSGLTYRRLRRKVPQRRGGMNSALRVKPLRFPDSMRRVWGRCPGRRTRHGRGSDRRRCGRAGPARCRPRAVRPGSTRRSRCAIGAQPAGRVPFSTLAEAWNEVKPRTASREGLEQDGPRLDAGAADAALLLDDGHAVSRFWRPACGAWPAGPLPIQIRS